MANLRTNNLSGEQGQNAYRGSVFFDGTDDYLSFADSSDFVLGTGDFTVEAWFLVSTNLDYRSLIDTRTSVNDDWMIGMRSNDRIYVYSGAFLLESSTGAVTPGHWHHVAYVRSSGTHALYLNGVSVATSSTSKDYDSQKLGISVPPYNLGAEEFSGYVSNVRIVKGTALYTGTFTPPRSELTAVDGTVVLCCQNSDDVTQEETGKTITANGNLATAGYNKTQPKVIPPYGVDAGNAFGGPIQQSSQGYMYFPTGRTEERGRGRGVFAGGYAPSPASLRNIIDFIEIQSLGNAQDFGDLLSINNGESGACSSSTRALYGGGQSNTVDITFITIANTSNATDFGDLITGRRSLSAVSSDTRGLFAGGTTPSMKNEIEFVTIATAGNASDFGDLTVGRRNMAPNSSPTRGVFAGGNPGSSPLQDDTIDFVTIASAGNATDFGNLITAMREQAGSSSATRGLIAGGYTSPANLNTIEFITIASTGNASDFGDLHTAVSGLAGTSNGTRGIFAGGAYINNIQFVTIASTGNAGDFGDLTAARFLYDGTSDSHGGLS